MAQGTFEIQVYEDDCFFVLSDEWNLLTLLAQHGLVTEITHVANLFYYKVRITAESPFREFPGLLYELEDFVTENGFRMAWRDPYTPCWNWDLTSEDISAFIDGGETLEAYNNLT